MAGRPLRPATRRSLGRPLPHQQADRTRPHLIPQKNFPTITCDHVEHLVLPPVSRSYPKVQGRLVTYYSPVRHSHPVASYQDPVRLACVKHAASVHPEPESNPPQKTKMESPQKWLQKRKRQNPYKEKVSHKNPSVNYPTPRQNPPNTGRKTPDWQSKIKVVQTHS